MNPCQIVQSVHPYFFPKFAAVIMVKSFCTFFFFAMGIIVKSYCTFPFLFTAVILVESYCTVPSVVDQWHFVTDLDPQIHTTALRIRIRIQLQIWILLFLSVAFQTPGYLCLLFLRYISFHFCLMIKGFGSRSTTPSFF
jgi:hypothetical protein